MRTLSLRLDRHQASADAVAAWPVQQEAVERVLYPGLPDHPGHAAAARQMRDYGGMVSFTVRGGEQIARQVAASTQLFTLAESLGGVESLIEVPGQMTHASVAGSPLEAVAANEIKRFVGTSTQAMQIALKGLQPQEGKGGFPARLVED